MRILILTSSLSGTAAVHLPQLVESNCCHVAMVIHCKGALLNKKKFYFQKFQKMRKIGLLGAINGVRMRKWFNEDVEQYVSMGNIEEYCKTNGIPFFSVERINSEQTVQLFKQAKAEVGISLGNGYINKNVFSLPTYGMINVHHEILPDFQNAQSIIWQIYNLSTFTGFTIHKIDQHIDTGEILYQEKVMIDFRENLADTIAVTSAKLLQASASGLIYVLRNFKTLFAEAKPQGKGKKYTTPSIGQYLKIKKNHKILRMRQNFLNRSDQ